MGVLLNPEAPTLRDANTQKINACHLAWRYQRLANANGSSLGHWLARVDHALHRLRHARGRRGAPPLRGI